VKNEENPHISRKAREKWGTPMWRVRIRFGSGVFSLTLWCISVLMACASVFAQDAPPQSTSPSDQPKDEQKNDTKKEDTVNPVQAVADKTKEVTAQAADATKQLGQVALRKARDWEGSWVTGAFIRREGEIAPLSARERRDLYLEQTLTTPGAYLKRMFAAGIDQARGSPRQWQGGIGGYGERFASREGQFIAANSLAALGNAKLQYEPRYDQCACSGFWPRARHAIVRNFITYNRTEHQRRPQWALYGGAFGGGLISTAWKPHPRNAFAEGGRAMLGQAGYGALLNFFIEFAGDINRKIGARK
jgi:hypothetical protein